MANLSIAKELKTYLRQTAQVIFHRVNEQFDEIEWEWSELSHFAF